MCVKLRSDLFVYKHIQLARAWGIEGLKKLPSKLANNASFTRRERGIGRK